MVFHGGGYSVVFRLAGKCRDFCPSRGFVLATSRLTLLTTKLAQALSVPLGKLDGCRGNKHHHPPTPYQRQVSASGGRSRWAQRGRASPDQVGVRLGDGWAGGGVTTASSMKTQLSTSRWWAITALTSEPWAASSQESFRSSRNTNRHKTRAEIFH